MHKSLRVRISILRIAVILTAILVFPIIYFYFFYSVASSNLDVYFLDVGQGDAILIQTPFGQNILLDGGPDSKVMMEISDILPWWDRTIDLMILSHPHDDHIAGLTEVLKRYQVKNILYTGVVVDSPNFLSWLEIVKAKNIPLLPARADSIFTLGENCSLKIFYPEGDLWGQESGNLNNASLVVKLTFQQNNFLFAGDIESPVEEDLLEKYCINYEPTAEDFSCQPTDPNFNLHADVFKANHHGSDTSNTENFLRAVNPSFAVIQVGAENKFGHPSQRVLNNFSKLSTGIYRSDIDGRILISSDGELIKVQSQTP